MPLPPLEKLRGTPLQRRTVIEVGKPADFLDSPRCPAVNGTERMPMHQHRYGPYGLPMDEGMARENCAAAPHPVPGKQNADAKSTPPINPPRHRVSFCASGIFARPGLGKRPALMFCFFCIKTKEKPQRDATALFQHPLINKKQIREPPTIRQKLSPPGPAKVRYPLPPAQNNNRKPVI